MEPQRVAKLIARAGVCSRRDAERLIAEGRVKLDGKVLDTPAVVVD
ncbi:MAG: rRNA pseudouridine synthase, partial [Rhodospirillales bacterium]|nr:rRNA pseudouridine synthase [Rhodospirillales bacterium]